MSGDAGEARLQAPLQGSGQRHARRMGLHDVCHHEGKGIEIMSGQKGDDAYIGAHGLVDRAPPDVLF